MKVEAETMRAALEQAYLTNPQLQQSRAQQRALNETFVQALAILRPTLTVAASAQYQDLQLGKLVQDSNSGLVTATATQPIYTSGRGTAQQRAALFDIYAGREALRQTEISVLGLVIQAYLDVRRDSEIVAVRIANEEVLGRQAKQISAKFEAGQLTRTDLAQGEAQAAQARGLLSSARAQLRISGAAYTAVVGQAPGALEKETFLPELPRTLGAALATAESESPVVRQTQNVERASRERVVAARASAGPTISLGASFGYVGALSPFAAEAFQRDFATQVTITQPIFQGGLLRSLSRQARAQNASDRIGVEGARRQVDKSVTEAWEVMTSSSANVASDTDQVKAARVAVEGVQEEYRVGLRTTLDVLVTQQNLRDAELQLIAAHHDEYVARSQLLAAMGQLEIRCLVGDEFVYDVEGDFTKIRKRSSLPWDPFVEALDSLASPDEPDLRQARGLAAQPLIGDRHPPCGTDRRN